MNSIFDQSLLRNRQYKTPHNLQARMEIHRRFSRNPCPWFQWEFNRLAIQPGETVLDLGCGPGDEGTLKCERKHFSRKEGTLRIWIWILILVVAGGCIPPVTDQPLKKPTPTLVVQSTAPEIKGLLIGHVTIGPLTPVVRIDQPTPTIPPEVFTSRQLDVYQADGKTWVSSVQFKSDGTYQISLMPGNYVIALPRKGIEHARELPKEIKIEAGQTVIVDIDIDTGMR
jgi:hypothetical protein